MEWWHVFGIGFIVFTVLYIQAAISRQAKSEKKQEKLLLMNGSRENGGWLDKNDSAAANHNEISRKEDDFYDEDESFVTKLPRAINRGFNSILTNLNLRNKVKTGRLEVVNLNNALEYAQTLSELENIKKKHQITNLELDREIVEGKENLADAKENDDTRKLKNKSRRLDYELEIAAKKKQLEELHNPPAPVKEKTPEEKKQQQRDEVEAKIANLEEKKRALENDELISQDTRKLQVNQIDNKLHDLYQESLDLL